MQAVIMAAGRGSRMGKITEDTPKPLLVVKNKTILEHKFDALPDSINEVIVVINYLGEKIKNHLGDRFNNKDIVYIEQKDMFGTAGALWQAKHLLENKFLVVNGDDFYNLSEMNQLVKNDLAMGLSRNKFIGDTLLSIKVGDSGEVQGWNFEKAENSLIINGAYVLDKRIFNYEPEQIGKGEFGLPHTILKMSRDYPIKGIIMDYWYPLNTPEDIKEFEKSG